MPPRLCLDHMAAAALTTDTGKNTQICRPVNHPIRSDQRLVVAGAAQIGMVDLDSTLLQGEPINFASLPNETKYLCAIHIFADGLSQRAPDKSADATD